MKSKNNISNPRRKFIKQSVFAAGVAVVPRHVLGGVGYTAPSDQLNIAGIGVGGQGRGDLINATVKGRERVVALCDVHPGGEHGVKQIANKYSKATFYESFKEMLDKEKDIDAVTISTPDHTHAPAAVYAMERGVHVYVQKPLTHNIKEARLLTEMAREKKIVTQMGNQGASNPDQLSIQAWIDTGKIGAVSKVYVWTNRPVWPQGIPMPIADGTQKPVDLNWDQWLGPAPETAFIPNMHPFNWRGWWEYGTGALGDMGCHIIDIPFRALGLKYPTDVECSVGSVYSKMWVPDYNPEGCPPSSSITLHFEPTAKNNSKIEMIWTDGGIRPTHPELIPADVDLGDNGIIMIGDNGIITADVYGANPKLYQKGEAVQSGDAPAESKKEAAFGHHRKWIDACKAGFNSKEHLALTSSFDYAGPLTETVLMGNIAIRSYLLRRSTKTASGRSRFENYGRKKLLWDGQNMRITNLEEANQFVGRVYRNGWEL